MQWGVIAMIVGILLSVMLHEAGHLLTAKKFGMKATQYFVGFGPTLWSFRRGETEYGVKAIPAGGFVKIVGMTPLEDVPPGDEQRAFYRQPAPQRAVVLAAGSLTHFLLAFLLLVGIFLTTEQEVPGTTQVRTVSACANRPDPAACDPSDPPSAARAAGVLPGDQILSFDGQPVAGPDDFGRLVRGHPGGPATLVVERAGEQVTLRPMLQRVSRPLPDDPGRSEEVTVIGVSSAETTARVGPVTAVRESTSRMGEALVLTGKALVGIPAALPRLARQAFGRESRDAESIGGVVGVVRAGGQAAESDFGWAGVLGIVAALNVSIGILNLLPLLPLDGGHLAVLGFEEGRRGLARLFGRRDPGPVDLRKLLPAAYLVIAVFTGLFLLTLYADIYNPVPNPFSG